MDHERNKKRNLKIPKDKCEQKYHTSKSMRCSKNASEKEVHSNMGLPQKTRKFPNKQSNFTPKETRKKEQSPKFVEGRK